MKGTNKEKKLASTFIAKFAKSFPELESKSIDAMFDLCEDEDIVVSFVKFYFSIIEQSCLIYIHVCIENRFANRPSKTWLFSARITREL